MSRVPPAHAAASIYSEGDFIYVQLRASKGYTTELSFPATPGSMAALLRLLRQREIAGATAPQAIAFPSMPIQHVVDAWTKEHKVTKPAPKPTKEPSRPEPLPFDLSDLFT
jgi:hypothetical protein